MTTGHRDTEPPTLMPEDWVPPSQRGRANPAWDTAMANPGRWVKTTLTSRPTNLSSRNLRLSKEGGGGEWEVTGVGQPGGGVVYYLKFTLDGEGEA
jgi:hypothetical protein